MKKIIIGLFTSFIVIGVAFAANNFIKAGNNWDANVIPNVAEDNANDVFTMSGRLDLEESTSPEYAGGYRGKLSDVTIESELFGDFLALSDLDLLYKRDYVSSDDCGTGETPYEIYEIGLGQEVESVFWGKMSIQNSSYFCSNQYMHIVLNSDSLGNKDIGDGNNTNLVDNFGKQQIAISGIANLKDGTDGEILARGDSNIAKVSVSTNNKTIVKTEINKNVYLVMRSLLDNVSLNQAKDSTGFKASLDEDFSNTGTKNHYYLYDYSNEPEEEIGFVLDSGGKYKNKGKILHIEDTPSRYKLGITGKNVVIVEGGNIYINTNLYNTNDNNSLLVIVSKRSKDGKGGNIYVDSEVTNIDAVLIADGSLISANVPKVVGQDRILSLPTDRNYLRKQLLIYGSVLSSNSVGTDVMPYGTDYYQDTAISTTNEMNSSIYDLGNLRTFNLNYGSGSICGDGTKVVPIDGSGGYEEYAWAGGRHCYNESPSDDPVELFLRGSTKKNPLIIEYNPHITKISPYILQKN